MMMEKTEKSTRPEPEQNNCFRHTTGAARIGNGKAETAYTRLVFSAQNTRELFETLTSGKYPLPQLETGDFRRADETARISILAALLAFLDAGRKSGGNIAILDAGHDGCLSANLRYWRDYVQFGRTLGRGHLFVGTLPTTPLCEAAITLGLTGGGFYLDSLANNRALTEEIDSILAGNPETEAILLFLHRPGELRSFYLERGKTEDSAKPPLPPWANPENTENIAEGENS